ncbi:MAG TPA: hypothetical protein VMV14_00280 [Acidimicrobiales bacterium]|nr:hypothetical protein [Acidimicrobiales bacterium]
MTVVGAAGSAGATRSAERRAARAVVGAVAGRPWLWGTAALVTLRLARPGWWRRWPPMPWPEPQLWRFRVETAYGGEGDATPTPTDVVSFLGWCRDMRHWRRR